MMTKEEIKSKVLDTECFKSDEWLDKYAELIYSNRNNTHIPFKTQNHHIIPKHVFKYLKIDSDNSKSNLVELSYKNHILAHIYLALSASKEYIKCANNNAYRYMINTKDRNYYELDKMEDIIDEFIDTYPELTRKYYSEETLLKFKRPKSEEHKAKLRQLRWCNDGVNEFHYYINDGCPADKINGRLKDSAFSKASIGAVWINNGIKNLHPKLEKALAIMEADPSFEFGMLDRGEDWYNNVSNVLKNKSDEWCKNISLGKKQFFIDNPDFRNAGNWKPGQPSHNKNKKAITNGINNHYITIDEYEYWEQQGWHWGQTQKRKGKINKND